MIRWQSPPIPLSPESDYDRRLQQHLDRLYVSLTQTWARAVDSAGDTMSGALTVTDVSGFGVSPSGLGGITLRGGAVGRSGYVEFYSDAGVRLGYYGFSPSSGPGDGGTLIHQAGIHAFTGAVLATDGSRTLNGVLSAVPAATATTLFAATQGLWLVAAYIPGILPTFPGYAASAHVVHDGSGMRVIPQNDTGLTISGSGVNVQVTQGSGVPQNIGFSALRVF